MALKMTAAEQAVFETERQQRRMTIDDPPKSHATRKNAKNLMDSALLHKPLGYDKQRPMPNGKSPPVQLKQQPSMHRNQSNALHYSPK